MSNVTLWSVSPNPVTYGVINNLGGRHTHTHTCTHTHTHIHIHIHTYIYTYIHTHKHTCIPTSQIKETRHTSACSQCIPGLITQATCVTNSI